MDIGYFTAVTMCYFLAEGYEYTHDRKAYALRLLAFALISQIPYQLALGFFQLNMLFTLLACLGTAHVAHEMGTRPGERLGRNFAVLLGLFLVSLFMDWGTVAPLFTFLFCGWRYGKAGLGGRRSGLALVFLGDAVIFFFQSLPAEWTAQAMLHTAASTLGILAAGAVILLFYNGKRARARPGVLEVVFLSVLPGPPGGAGGHQTGFLTIIKEKTKGSARGFSTGRAFLC